MWAAIWPNGVGDYDDIPAAESGEQRRFQREAAIAADLSGTRVRGRSGPGPLRRDRGQRWAVADTGERECPPGLAEDRRTCYHRGVTRGSADGPSDRTTSNQDCGGRSIESDRLRCDDGSARRPYRARAGIEAGLCVPPNFPARSHATRRNPQKSQNKVMSRQPPLE